ncbi:MAG TPA: DoxX family membrane protein [Trichormus sp.]|jgi:uncharacterized membrane protein
MKRLTLIVLAVMFIAAGILHFTRPQPFVSIVPDYLPQPLLLVWISGVCEIAGGIGLLWARTRRLAAFGLIALLIAVFPANINMATSNITFGGTIPEIGLWLRLPLQFVLIALVWWCAVSAKREPT